MEKRILLAFVLSFAVLYAFRSIYAPPASETTPATPSAETAPTPTPREAQEPADAPRVRLELAPPRPGTEVRAESAEDIAFETTLYTATISNVGGVLKSYKLKAYADAEGRPIELIDARGGEKVGWPLAIVSGDAAVDEALGKAPFVVLRDGDRIEFEYASGSLHARKSLEFNRLNYEFSIETSVSREGKALPHSVVWQGGFGDQSITADPAKIRSVYQVENEYDRTYLGSLAEPQQLTTHRVGVEDQYFMAMFMLDQPGTVTLRQQDYADEAGKAVGTLTVVGPAQEETSTRIYAGPKDDDWLRRAEPDLVAVINYGMFGFIAKPMLMALLWIHSYVGNFGWAIIILTVALNFVLFPLRLKQQISMQKMQKIQPQMKTLQDKYKKLKANDPKRPQVQAEMMGLYKQHGVNPMGGCLPLLLQMPFFFAIWSMLSEAIELRRAPWMLWIQDLSQHDPYYIIPILMALSMVAMQKMTPTTVDPAQAKIMMVMPLMLTFMFFWIQSGVTLYWLTGNIVGIGQQYFINHYWSASALDKSKAGSRSKESPAK